MPVCTRSNVSHYVPSKPLRWKPCFWPSSFIFSHFGQVCLRVFTFGSHLHGYQTHWGRGTCIPLAWMYQFEFVILMTSILIENIQRDVGNQMGISHFLERRSCEIPYSQYYLDSSKFSVFQPLRFSLLSYDCNPSPLFCMSKWGQHLRWIPLLFYFRNSPGLVYVSYKSISEVTCHFRLWVTALGLPYHHLLLFISLSSCSWGSSQGYFIPSVLISLLLILQRHRQH